MGIFNCRCTAKTIGWERIDAHNAVDAASWYAEEGHAEDGDIVTVMFHGNYKISEEQEISYYARKVK